MLGTALGMVGANQADKSQEDAAGAGNSVQNQMYNITRTDEKPYQDMGNSAVSQMQDPRFQKNFSMADFQADPGYQFSMQQGEQALQRSAAANGGLMGGATLKALTQYGQGMGAQEYQQVYDRFNQQQQQQFGRLSTMAGMGQQAIGAENGMGLHYADAVNSNDIGYGNAQAGMLTHNYGAVTGMENQYEQMVGTEMSMVGGGGGGKGGGGGAGMAAMFCDERLKKDIELVSKQELDELRSCLKAYRFRYKDPDKHGKGQFMGVMAQDLEKSKLGKTLVFRDNDGNLQVDVGRALMLFLATMAEA